MNGISFTEFGNSGEPLVFLHANGYPPGCYRPLLERLAGDQRLLAMVQRPLWADAKPNDIRDWRPLTDDLLRFLDERQLERPVVIGHSMGGIALLRAAIRQPERFKAIVLLDPVLFMPNFIRMWWMMYHTGLGYRIHPLVKAARYRRQAFNDLDKLFNGYRRKSIFRHFDDGALRAYVEGIACPDGTGYRLCYSAEWEMRIYVTGVWRDLELWRGLRTLSTPTLILRGAETDTFLAGTAQRVQKVNPAVRIIALEKSTHLLPLERPAEVHHEIKRFIEETL
ncbi:MAG: alpha/beta fold hydrolase [Chloroflexota bacterium]